MKTLRRVSSFETANPEKLDHALTSFEDNTTQALDRRVPLLPWRDWCSAGTVKAEYEKVTRVDTSVESLSVTLPTITPATQSRPVAVAINGLNGATLIPTNAGATINGAPSLFVNSICMLLLHHDGSNWFCADNSASDRYNVLLFGASPNARPSANTAAIQRAISAAERAGGGDVVFPGGRSTRYPINGTLYVTGSDITLLAPGNAKLKIASGLNIAICVGDIETGANLTQGNTLASNALKGSRTVTLSAGKGANITVGARLAIWSDAVTPDGDPSVVFNKVSETCKVQSIAGDVLTLEAPLHYSYLTADNAEVYNVDWAEDFTIKGLGVDGNNQTDCRIFCQMSWCLRANVEDVEALDLQQRFIRFQGCVLHRASFVRQINGLSNGFYSDTGHFSYMVSEQGLCEKGVFTNLQADRIRHGYTTGAGWTNNDGTTSAVLTGIGIPMDTIVSNGTATNMRGAGWDTHEVGADISFNNLHVAGSISVGFQIRSVRTRIKNCYARDVLGAAIQIGGDGIDTVLEGFEWDNCNLEPDLIDPTFDWSLRCGIVDNGLRTTFGTPGPNHVDNGNFDVWDRGTSYAATGATANRWQLLVGPGETIALSRQTHDGAAPSGAQSGRYFMRCNRTATGVGDPSYVSQRLPDVRTLAGQRILLSFDARSAGTVRTGRVWLRQHFGTGGAPDADIDTPAVELYWDNGWIRQFVIIDVPEIDTAATFGTNDDSASVLIFEWPIDNGDNFFDLDRVKIEVSRYPTTFAPESLAETRERCLRWFECSNVDGQAPGSATSQGNVIASSAAAPGGHANAWGRTVHFAARKARVPTVQTYAPTSGTAGNLRNLTTAADIAATVSNIGQSSFYVRPTNSASVAANDITACSWTASIAGYE